MAQQKSLLTGSLDEALTLIDEEILEVVGDLDLEKANLEDLVPTAEAETQRGLAELRGSIKGLQSRMTDLRKTLVTARELAGQIKSDGGEVSPELPVDATVTMNAREAAEERHDKPISLGEILRSLLMANEPAQRERARGDDQSPSDGS